MSQGRKSKKDVLLTALKQAILQQAIQGKLTVDWRAETPNTEPASELLKRIKAEKQKLIDEKKIRKEKPLPAISAEEIPFDLPNGWVWCRLGEVVELKSGQDLTKQEYNDENQGIPYLTGASHIINGRINISRWTDSPKNISVLNDLIITCKGTIGKTTFNNIGDIHIARQIMAIRVILSNHQSRQFLKLYIDSYVSQLASKAKSLIPGISRNHILHIYLPLPPLPEQTAIVQKVEALMQKCDALEKGESIQHYPMVDKKADQLLNRYEIGRQLLAELPQQQAQVKQLKQAVLQEAIQGKLTADWRAENPDIEPASELLKRIKAEKQKRIDEKIIRKEKPLAPISAEEIPFDLPDGWGWCRVGQLGVINRGKSPKYDKKGKNVILNQRCVRWFNVEIQHCKTISLDWYETLPDEIKTAVNDILINSTGEGTIGRSAIVDENSAGLLFDSHVLRFRTSIESPYIMTLINSDFGQHQINDLKGAKSTKQTELGVNNLSNMIFPLAPMLEQKKLVQKVEALMQTCTDLETQIKQSETHATQLMQAVIKEAFETEKASATP